MFSILWEWLNSSNGVWTSLFSAFSFLFIVFFGFRPWFYISKRISSKDGIYKFKIINFTLVKCWDVKVYLRKVNEERAYPKGKDLSYTQVDLKTPSYVYISGAVTGIFNEERPNCIQAKVVKEDVKKIVEEPNVYLELIITGRHGLTGLQKAKKRKFQHVKFVKEGAFESGFSDEIVS
jgi:hypothetical protein